MPECMVCIEVSSQYCVVCVQYVRHTVCYVFLRVGMIGFVVSLGGMYILKILRCLWLARCILICCSSISLLLVVCSVFNSVKIMSFFMYVISPPPFL